MNFLTQKLAGRNEINQKNLGLLYLPNIEQEKKLCEFASRCKDYLSLQESRIRDETPDEDLIDQYYELCTHPADGAREISCLYYKMFKSVENVLNSAQKDISEYYETGIN